MAFTLIGWSESQSATTLSNVAGLADPHVRVEGDDIIVPELKFLSAYYACGSQTTQARLSSPSLRRIVEPDIEPIDTVDEPSSNPPLHDRFDKPFELDRGEALNFKAAQASGTWRSTGLAWLSDGKIAPLPAGKIITVRATSNTTLTAYEWTNGALTFAQTLPAGKYAIVGMRAQSNGLIAARLVIPGFPWRPGVLGFDADADVDYRRFRYGALGSWGEFMHNEPPTVDFLSISADTSEVVHLDLVYLG